MKPRSKFFRRSGWEVILVISALLCGLCTSTWADSSAEQQKRLEAHYALERPEGSGPFPAVMLVPACIGFDRALWNGTYARVAKKLKDQGFVVLKVDYFAAREALNCPAVTQEDVAQDITTTVRYLRAQSFVKTTAINVLAWGHGGGGALSALSEGENRSPAAVDAVLVYYPRFIERLPSPWKVDVPVLFLCAAKDFVAPPSRCEDLLSQIPARDRVKFIVYPDVYHGFDNSDLPAQMVTPTGTWGYNEKAAKAAWEEVERFLRR